MLDGDDRLIVVDRLSRRLTIFTDMGKDFSTGSTINKGFVMPNPILSLDGTFLLSEVRRIANPKGGPSLKTAILPHPCYTN